MSEIDISKCPALHKYNVLGLDDRDCCYKYHKYCNEVVKCEFKSILNANNDYKKQYDVLLTKYHDVLKLAKQNADTYEYCMRDTERLYEKAITKLKENGLYNAKDFESEE